MKAAAIVVTFNRFDLLVECISSLEQQTRPIDEIIVVDNGSTDGTATKLAFRYPHLRIIRSEKNLGGAGGFALGLDVAMANGHDAAWIMDDDACPRLEAFDALSTDYDSGLLGEFGFIASTVIGEDGGELSTHNANSIGEMVPGTNCFPVEHAAFVGVLINLHAAQHTWLPMLDFFIHHDDFEYTSRLSEQTSGYRSLSSLIQHPDKRVAPDTRRLYYDIRNRLWIQRSKDLASAPVRERVSKRLILHTLAQGKVAPKKFLYLNVICRAWGHGLLRRPKYYARGAVLELALKSGWIKEPR